MAFALAAAPQPPPPPPAHWSPRASALHASSLLVPVQTAPEDLRVVARKLEFPSSSDDEQSVDMSVSGNNREHAFPCPECGKAYSTSSNLARHRQTHRYLVVAMIVY
jgi:predicted RNA-binding Zn-ribbon protein involved in translation (DUF1610 family)